MGAGVFGRVCVEGMIRTFAPGKHDKGRTRGTEAEGHGKLARKWMAKNTFGKATTSLTSTRTSGAAQARDKWVKKLIPAHEAG